MFKVAAIVSALVACASATLETVKLAHPLGSTAEVALFGAHVLSFHSAKDPERNVFFMSKKSFMDGVNSITGGVSVVFPNFGYIDEDLPFDGLARISTWTLSSQEDAADDNSPAVATFTFASNEETRKHWVGEFALEYTVKLYANTLEMAFTAQNTHKEKIGFQAHLYNYLSVDSVFEEGVQINGLKGIEYFDTFAGAYMTETSDNVVITEQTEHIYINSSDVVRFVIRTNNGAQQPNDPAPTGKPVNRTVTITKYGVISGSSPKSTPTDFAVWNPWAEGAALIGDFGDDEYEYMVAAGPGHLNDVVVIAPGDSFTLHQNITVG